MAGPVTGRAVQGGCASTVRGTLPPLSNTFPTFPNNISQHFPTLPTHTSHTHFPTPSDTLTPQRGVHNQPQGSDAVVLTSLAMAGNTVRGGGAPISDAESENALAQLGIDPQLRPPGGLQPHFVKVGGDKWEVGGPGRANARSAGCANTNTAQGALSPGSTPSPVSAGIITALVPHWFRYGSTELGAVTQCTSCNN